jgi:hypothetical protein
VQIKLVDFDNTRRREIKNSVLQVLTFGDRIDTTEIIVDTQSQIDLDLNFLHVNNMNPSITLAGLTKDVVLYSGDRFRDFSDAEQASGKVFKIYRSLDRDALFSDNLKRGFIEILEYFKNGKQGQLPSLLVKAAYPDELFSVYLTSIAQDKGVKVTLRSEVMDKAKAEFEKLSTRYFDTETLFNESNVRSMIGKIAEECSKP